MRQIQDKIIGYQLYHQQKVFQKFGPFSGFRVLIQTTSPKRAKNMRHALLNMAGTELAWITDREQVWEDTVLSGEIWQDHELEIKSILK
ncbi:hypothetical protein [Acanthopleuribacter pedis]